MKRFFSSESVTEGHPDKVCDYIADSILDEMLKQDPSSRVACEVCATENFVLVMGEVTSKAIVNIEVVVRNAIKEIGYDKEEYGFDYQTCDIKVMLKKQSPDIALGVDREGAGDQGIIFGFACDETENYMPAPIHYAHKLSHQLAKVRKEHILDYLRPDGKTEVTFEYEDGIPKRIEAIVISAQHNPGVTHEQIESDLKKEVIQAVIPKGLLDDNTKYFINPTGNFVIGGPVGDSGLTGRKIIVDTYGGYAAHGGGAFSGKDPTKVDRSAAYMARKVAKDIVAQKMAKKCQIQITYAIGVAQPVAINVDTYGTSTLSEEELLNYIQKNYDLTPTGMIRSLNLKSPIYKETTNYGHFGKKNLPWE